MTTQNRGAFQPGCTVRVVGNSRSFLPEGIEIGGEYWYKETFDWTGVRLATLRVPRDGVLVDITMYEGDLEVVHPDSDSHCADWTGAPDTDGAGTW